MARLLHLLPYLAYPAFPRESKVNLLLFGQAHALQDVRIRMNDSSGFVMVGSAWMVSVICSTSRYGFQKEIESRKLPIDLLITRTVERVHVQALKTLSIRVALYYCNAFSSE